MKLDPFVGTVNWHMVEQIAGNFITHRSTFTLTNGQTRQIAEAWLEHDLMNSQSTREYKLNPKVLFLPTLRGFGNIADLHVVMSERPALLTMVELRQSNWVRRIHNPP